MTGGLAGVLFDMDGTLVDSEKVWEVALHELADRLGGRLSGPARAALLGVPPAGTVAIEDSPTGIESARTAGCVVLGIPSEVDLAGTAGITVRDSLVGVDVPYLESLVEA